MFFWNDRLTLFVVVVVFPEFVLLLIVPELTVLLFPLMTVLLFVTFVGGVATGVAEVSFTVMDALVFSTVTTSDSLPSVVLSATNGMDMTA